MSRIKAVRDFGDVIAGDLGGWIEKEENLSHEGNCWIYDKARVFGNAWIEGDATIREATTIRDNVLVCEHASVEGHAIVCENVRVFGNAKVAGCAVVHNMTEVF